MDKKNTIKGIFIAIGVICFFLIFKENAGFVFTGFLIGYGSGSEQMKNCFKKRQMYCSKCNGSIYYQ